MVLRTDMKLEACIKTLLVYSPVLGYVLQELDRVETRQVPTMGVGFVDKDARIALYYNPDFVDKMSEETLIKVVLPHEVAHIVNGHLGRYSAEEFRRLNARFINIGLDMSVNCEEFIDMKAVKKANKELRDLGKKEIAELTKGLKEAMEKGGASDEEIAAMKRELKKMSKGISMVLAETYKLPYKQSTDFYMLELMKQAQQQKQSGGSGGKGNEGEDGEGTGGGDKDGENGESGGEGFDSHKFGESKLSASTQQSISKSTVASGYKEWVNHGKQRGHTPGGCVEMIEGMLFPKQPVAKAFRNLIGSYIGSDFEPSSSRIHKRTGTYVSPGKRIKNKLKLAIVIDTSGSMGGKDLELFRGMVKRLQQEIDPHIYLIHCDAEVQKAETLRGTRVPVEFKGRGGTDFTPAFQALKKQRVNPDVVVFYTDGYGALEPEYRDLFRTLWVVTPGGSGSQDFMGGRRAKVMKLDDYDSAS